MQCGSWVSWSPSGRGPAPEGGVPGLRYVPAPSLAPQETDGDAPGWLRLPPGLPQSPAYFRGTAPVASPSPSKLPSCPPSPAPLCKPLHLHSSSWHLICSAPEPSGCTLTPKWSLKPLRGSHPYCLVSPTKICSRSTLCRGRTARVVSRRLGYCGVRAGRSADRCPGTVLLVKRVLKCPVFANILLESSMM